MPGFCIACPETIPEVTKERVKSLSTCKLYKSIVASKMPGYAGDQVLARPTPAEPSL